MTKYKVEEHRNDVTILVESLSLPPVLYRITRFVTNSFITSRSHTPHLEKSQGISSTISPPLLFFENCDPAMNYITAPLWLSAFLGIYGTKQKQPPSHLRVSAMENEWRVRFLQPAGFLQGRAELLLLFSVFVTKDIFTQRHTHPPTCVLLLCRLGVHNERYCRLKTDRSQELI